MPAPAGPVPTPAPTAGRRSETMLDRALAASVSRRAETRLPDPLKSGIERLSGIAMDDVRVHYQSSRPAALGAAAYAQGSDIHVAPGQEQQLPHEAWHVVQQLSGRVAPTSRLGGTAVNEDPALEREADTMGARAEQGGPVPRSLRAPGTAPGTVAQLGRAAERLMARGAAQILIDIDRVPAQHRGPLIADIVKYFTDLPDRQLEAKPWDKVLAITSVLSPAQRDIVVSRRNALKSIVDDDLTDFAEQFNYRISPTPFLHELFGHPTITLYPIQKSAEQLEEDRLKGMSSIIHRPILDVEQVGGKFYIRCYLGLFAQAPDSSYKDITAKPSGEIEFSKILLMNVGNPFKALLWCEDYLVSDEHGGGASPVLRSFLVSLADAADVFAGTHNALPVDQNRGAGQFKSAGVSAFEGKLKPLPGSLVSFFYDKTLAAVPQPGQIKRPLSDLQSFVTGVKSDAPPQALGKSEIAAQHGRGGMIAEWEDEYESAMEAYYSSLGLDLGWQVRDIRQRLVTASGTEKSRLTLTLRKLEKKLGIAKDAPTTDEFATGFSEPLKDVIKHKAHR